MMFFSSLYNGGAASITVEAMMSRPLVTIAPDAELWEARAKMRAHHIHHLLVEDRGRIVGIMSDRDIAHRLAPSAGRDVASRHDEEALHRRVLQVAAFQMTTIAATASIEEAAAALIEREVSALPVLDASGAAVGIVTSVDLLRGLLACVLPARAA